MNKHQLILFHRWAIVLAAIVIVLVQSIVKLQDKYIICELYHYVVITIMHHVNHIIRIMNKVITIMNPDI